MPRLPFLVAPNSCYVLTAQGDYSFIHHALASLAAVLDQRGHTPVPPEEGGQIGLHTATKHSYLYMLVAANLGFLGGRRCLFYDVAYRQPRVAKEHSISCMED